MFKYSPIVSKFIDKSELEKIEIVEPTYDNLHMIVIKKNGSVRWNCWYKYTYQQKTE